MRANGPGFRKLGQNGWNVSLAGGLTRTLSVVADFSNHYGTNSVPFSPIGSDGKGLTYFFGPQYRFGAVPRLTPFAHALFGAMQANKFLPGPLAGSCPAPACSGVITESETAFAAAFGGGLDVKAVDRVWIRLFQLDYVRANLSAVTQNDLRVSTGLVFRFGHK